jgi:heme A synthase
LQRDVHRTGTIVLSASLMVIGVAIVVRTLDGGGGAASIGIVLGVLFVLAGAGRLWVATRGERP